MCYYVWFSAPQSVKWDSSFYAWAQNQNISFNVETKWWETIKKNFKKYSIKGFIFVWIATSESADFFKKIEKTYISRHLRLKDIQYQLELC